MLRKTTLLITLFALGGFLPAQAAPEKLTIDKGHTFIGFKVSHIGFAWMPGFFTEFDGTISYDPENPANSKTEFTVRMPSLTTFHAERDKHLKSDDFFDVARHSTARFVSTSFEETGEDTATLRGDLTIMGTTKPVQFKVTELAGKEDPWGNFRRAWSAETTIRLADFGLNDFGGAAATADVKVALEAVRGK